MKITTIVLLFAASGAALAEPAAAPQMTPAELAIQRAQKEIAAKPGHAAYYNNLAMAYARRARETSDVAFYTKADEAVAESLRIEPGNFEGEKTKVWLLLGRHEFAKAAEAAAKLNKKSPDDLTVYGYMADANAELGNYEEAIRATQWMLDLRPGNVPGMTRAAYLRELHGEISNAIAAMQEALEGTGFQEFEDRAWFMTQIAHLNLIAGDLKAAETNASGALQLFPDYHYALAAMAQVRIAQGRYDDAVTLLKKRYEKAPHAENLFALANAMKLAGMEKEAAKAYAEFETASLKESGITDNSNHELIAYYVDEARNPAKALEIAQLEMTRRHDVYTLDCYAWALAASGDGAKALEQSRRAIAVGVQDPRVLYHAGVIETRFGDAVKGKKLLESAAAKYSHEAAEFLH